MSEPAPATPADPLADISQPPHRLVDQVIRFGLVGVANTGVDLLSLNFLLLLFPAGRMAPWFSVCKSLSFMVAVANSYLLNRRFTFKSDKKASSAQVGQYIAVSIGGLLINVGVATLVMTQVPAPDVLKPFWPSIAALSGIPVGLVWNFLGYRLLVF